MPVVNSFPDVQSAVIADMEARRQVGLTRYGTALQPHNGRDALLDLYEELLDGCMYLKQVMIERAVPCSNRDDPNDLVSPCGDWPAPCNCDDPESHDR